MLTISMLIQISNQERFDASGKGKGKEGRVDPQVTSTQYLSTLSLTFSYNLHIKGEVVKNKRP